VLPVASCKTWWKMFGGSHDSLILPSPWPKTRKSADTAR
jgi:hypothetical protein